MSRSLGVFDSGLGGLTVVRALRAALPNEDIVYLGDTARVPYGTKGPATVTRYALTCANHLVARGVKAIVVACNTVSAVALDVLRAELDMPVVGVIEPGALEARHIRLFTRDWWTGYPPRDASELGVMLGRLRTTMLPDDVDYRTPWEKEEQAPVLVEYELEQVRRSLANVRAMGICEGS